MAWRDKILAGSFRGVPFVVDSADGDIGRRVALHEYPQRDKPYAEDLGRKARKFSLEFFVVGADYMATRDRMVEALEASGKGKLVHPYLGEMTVTVMEARGPRETTREGGMARFSVTFVEAGEALFPSGAADGGETVKAKAVLAATAIQREFARKFDVTGPAWVSDHATSLITRVATQINAIKNTIPNLPATAVQFAADLARLTTNTQALIRTPADLAVDVYELIAGIAQLPDQPLRAIDAYRPLFNAFTGELEIATTTPMRTKQATNQEAVIALTRRAAVVEASRAAANAEYNNLNEAIITRDELADYLDNEMDTADDSSFSALAELRADLVRYVATSAGDLARLVSYTPPVTMPALVIAHQLYGDAIREEEIISRNHFAHPGFVPGGAAIEVLTDA